MDYSRVAKLPQYFRNLARLSEIARVLLRHGFGDLLERLNLYPYLESGLRLVRSKSLLERPSAVDFGHRLRLVFEELGPTFIKFAQLIATRPDIFPANITREFRKLQDKVAPFSTEQAKQLVESELKQPIGELFASFDEVPLAAASIAQVHHATLQGGTEVAVKIQRPDIQRVLDSDIEILRGFAALIEENIPESRSFSPVELVEEFSRALKLECDFRREAANVKRFAALFTEEAGLLIPEVYSNLSSRKVLTERFIHGIVADDIASIETNHLDGKRLASILSRVLLRSVFEFRFFHADPHPGNVFVTLDNRIALVDFGSMGRLDRTRVSYILKFLVALFSSDLDRMVDILKETEVAPPVLDEIALKNQIAELLDTYLARNLGELDVSRLLTEVFEVARRYGMRPPPDLLLVGKSLTTLQHLAAGLDPGFDPLVSIKPYLLERYKMQLADPRIHASAIAEATRAWQRMAADLPVQIRGLLHNLVRERLTIHLASRDLAEKQGHLNRMMNRALSTVIGLAFLFGGAAMHMLSGSGLETTFSVVLMTIGALMLVSVWFAIRRTGGIS